MKTRMLAVLAAAGSAVACLAGCGSGGSPHVPVPVTIRGVAQHEPAASPRVSAAADTAFGLDLLRAWCRTDPHSNIVLSPESLASGLGMAYQGARGGTARAMARVLHLPAAGSALLADLQARSAALRAMSGPGVRVSSSDEVWADPTLVTRRQYLNDVATGYGAGVRHVSLLRRPARAAAQINKVVSEETRGHIPQLISPSSLRRIGWMLTDALYLKAAWAIPFQADKTASGQFRTAAGQRVSASFVSGGAFRYTHAAGWTAVSLPYRGDRLAMTAMLPGTGSAGPAGCPALTATDLIKITRALAAPVHRGGSQPPGPAGDSRLTGKVDVVLPKVKLSTHASMTDLLTRLGMGVAFHGNADFTGLSPQACCVGLVEHAATLQVGEKGTVASAATAVGLEPSAAPAPLLRVTFNRPYVLLITDTRTGEPLFLARVTDPTAS